EVNRVLEDYIPRRRDIVISQMRNENPRLFPMHMPPVFAGNQTSGAQMVELINPNKEEGDMYYTIDGSDPRKMGGEIHGLKYTKAFSIENSSIIKTRFLPKNSSEWSALAEKSYVFDKIYGQEIVISEIMYHPENNYPEFIELINTGKESVMLDGFIFSKGIEFTFQPGSNMFPGIGLVLTNDTALFRITYGFNAFGQYNKRLNNGGETLILKNRFHQIVDSVSYSDTIPWPVEADGDGYSLELIDQKTDNSLYSNWKISEIRMGTPFEPKTTQQFEAVLYPNPFTDMLYIEIANPELLYESFIVEVFNLYGSKVKSFEAVSSNLKIQIPAHNLSQGVYVIQIKTKRNSVFAEQKFKALKL
ncbi:MAG TPA: lamin tail domain-containing protein, partial [Draconibacterium sp.]|nr:lamin tail domain-containing protein [Draconibacterium sp.]